jgi:DNA mismatch endonuclease, patch repair protein
MKSRATRTLAPRGLKQPAIAVRVRTTVIPAVCEVAATPGLLSERQTWIMASVPSRLYVPPSPSASTPAVRASMQGNRRRDTSPERRLRSHLHGLGYRFRVDRPIRADASLIRPDIVFTRARIAIFVDGCFWHGCPEHGRTPTTNGDYWGPKLRRNRERDERQTRALEDAGWLVIRLWEHIDEDEAIAVVVAALASRLDGATPG